MFEWRAVLKKHFDGQDGSFLLHLRENKWDRDSFNELIHAMKACCIEHCDTEADSNQLDRWLATGFWDTETYAQMSIAHPSFRLEHSETYYKAAIGLLHELSYWYFMGESPAGPSIASEDFPLTLPE